jgi:hypothetical protein
MCDAGAERDYNAGAFVSGNKRQSRFDGPISLRRMQVGVTNPAGDNLYESLPWARGGYWNFANYEGLTEFFYHCCLHCSGIGHDGVLLK